MSSSEHEMPNHTNLLSGFLDSPGIQAIPLFFNIKLWKFID